MQFDGLDISPLDAAAPATLKMLKRSSNEYLNNWVTMCTSAMATAGTSGSVTFDNTCGNNSFSQFLIASTGSSVLPVTLLRFSGRQQQHTTLLEWEVAEEINLLAYEVQRSSDGINFKVIGNVDAINKTTYNFTDAQPVTGNNYYRIKLIDKDGRSRLSAIIKITFDKNGIIKLLPTPVKYGQPLRIQNLTAAATQVTLYLSDGKLFKKYTIAAGREIQVLDLPKGTIIYQATSATGNSISGVTLVL